MQLKTEPAGTVAVVTVEADALEAGCTKDFKRDLPAAAGERSQVVLDMGRVTFLDSSGIAALLAMMKYFKANGGGLKVCNLTESVKATFAMLRMGSVLEVCNSRDEGVQAFGG